MADENGTQGEHTGKDSAPAGGAQGAPGAPSGEGQGDDPKTYDEAYVKQLRDEAAANRVKAKRGEEAESRLRALAIAEGARGILQDPSDLPWSDAMMDADGYPDIEKIRASAEDLRASKPYLGRPAGDIGQGRHSEQDDTVSLSGLLRAGA